MKTAFEQSIELKASKTPNGVLATALLICADEIDYENYTKAVMFREIASRLINQGTKDES
jgi:hypothetical protein